MKNFNIIFSVFFLSFFSGFFYEDIRINNKNKESNLLEDSIIEFPTLKVIKEEFKINLVNTPSSLIGFVSVNGGSGSVIKITDGNAYVLTANHVVNKGIIHGVTFYLYDEYQVCFRKGYSLGDIVEQNNNLDYAILKVPLYHEYQTVKVIPFEDSKNMKIMDDVISVGSPARENYWVTKGVISSIKNNQIGHSTNIWFGSSGGILLNKKYEQIGVNVNIGRDTNNNQVLPHFGYATPMYAIYEDLGHEKILRYFP